MIAQCILNQLIFRYVLADSWFASVENMQYIEGENKYFIFDLKSNRLAQLVADCPAIPSKKNSWTSINDLNLSYNDFATIYKKRWSVEEYHKSIKQNASLTKSPTRTVKTQSNHSFL